MPSEAPALLAVMAHPDDEFAIFPWLVAAARAGRRVHCVWLTDGSWGSQSPPVRRCESTRVLSDFGIASERMLFLGEIHGFPDGSLHTQLQGAVAGLRELILSIGSPLQVLVPAWEGGHHDHDASHLAAIAASQGIDGITLQQYSLYHGAGLRGPLFWVMSPLPQNGPVTRIATSFRERLAFVSACLRYRSQWKSFAGLLPFYALRLLSRKDAFALQPVDPRRTAERPHRGLMLYERRTGLQWPEFAETTRRFRHH